MLHKKFAIALLLLLVSGAVSAQSPSDIYDSAYAPDKITLYIVPEFGYNIGVTDYFMDIPAGVVDDREVRLKSKLEFPLGAIAAGGRFGIEKNDDFGLDLSADAGVYFDFNDPSGKMVDDDWLAVENSADFKFSHTKSDVEMDYLRIDVNAQKRFLSLNKSGLYITAGYIYERIEQDIFGYDGWQIDLNDPDLERQYIFNESIHALYYWVIYHMPSVGVNYRLNLSSISNLTINTSGMWVFVEDFDDHLLRNKTAVADGSGPGIKLGLNYRLQPGQQAQKMKLFFDFGGQYLYTSIDTDQTQSWYGDDPATPGQNETGQSFSGIPHEISLSQLNLFIRVGFAF